MNIMKYNWNMLNSMEYNWYMLNILILIDIYSANQDRQLDICFNIQSLDNVKTLQNDSTLMLLQEIRLANEC